MDLPLPLEFIIFGDPVSQQTRRSGRLHSWIATVRDQVTEHWATEEESSKDFVIVTINYFHEDRNLDIDNLPKPILDALKGIVFEDDSQVTDLICQKRDLSAEFSIPLGSQVLRHALGADGAFVRILVDRAPY